MGRRSERPRRSTDNATRLHRHTPNLGAMRRHVRPRRRALDQHARRPTHPRTRARTVGRPVSARDDLATLVYSVTDSGPNRIDSELIADAILAAGWTPP